MNTLGKTITTKFYKSTTGFQDIEKFWRAQIANGFKPTAYDMLSYATIRGKNYRKGFTPITNQVKLDNGQDPKGALKKAHFWIRYKGPSPIFSEYLVDNIKEIIISHLEATTAETSYKVLEYAV
jgi:hypothetical protein